MKNKTEWQGSATELLKELEEKKLHQQLLQKY